MAAIDYLLKPVANAELDEIVRLESNSNYTHFYLANKSKLVSSLTMGYYEAMLPGENFIRIHHSYIVNTGHIGNER